MAESMEAEEILTKSADNETLLTFGKLRRSSSAPMINAIECMEDEPVFERQKFVRTRTYSASISVPEEQEVHQSPVNLGSPASRVLQIRREESVDELTKEVARERDVTSAIQLSRSWDEITWLTDKGFGITDDRRNSLEEVPLIFSSTLSSPSPSPVRLVDRHYARSLTPSPSPGPIPLSPQQRCFTRRSLSPSTIRPSVLNSKRKLDPDDTESYFSPPKRLNCLQPSISNSSASTCSSPDPQCDANGSCDDDSGSDHCFSTTTIHSPYGSNSLFCDTRQSNSLFIKPKYVAPPSPLAAGSSSSNLQIEPKRTSLFGSSYTFTPVKD